MIRASAPGKIVVAGAFVVLHGDPAVGLAVSPRLSLALDDGPPGAYPSGNPFARAAVEVLGLVPSDTSGLDVRAGFPMPVEGWSLGSSAAYSTALVAALSRRAGAPLSGSALFAAAREVHLRGQGGVGSGLDVACCALGGAVVFRDGAVAGPPVPWPDRLGVVVVRSPADGDTAARVRRYLQETPVAEGGDDPRARLRDAVEALIAALPRSIDLLPALAAVAVRESEWSAVAAPGLAPASLPAVKAALATLSYRQFTVAKSLGSGDAVGVFLDRRVVPEGEVLRALDAAGLPARAVAPDPEGARIEGGNGDQSVPPGS